MKKAILCLCLLLCPLWTLAASAPSEVIPLSQTQSLRYTLPEGVRAIEIEDVYDMKRISFALADPSLPTYLMLVSYSEELHEMDLADLDEDQLHSLVLLTAADGGEHAYEIREMRDGWPAVLITYDNEDDWVDAFTVISGYIVQIHGAHADYTSLDKAEEEYAFTLLDGLDIES